MTERQALIARKRAMQAARNRARRLEGVAVAAFLEDGENPRLGRCWREHSRAFYNGRPVSRLHYRSSREEVQAWLLENLRLGEGDGFFYRIGSVWAEIRILDPPAAVRSLWEERDVLLIAADFRRILGAGFDSRDEEHFLIDLLPLPPDG